MEIRGGSCLSFNRAGGFGNILDVDFPNRCRFVSGDLRLALYFGNMSDMRQCLLDLERHQIRPNGKINVDAGWMDGKSVGPYQTKRKLARVRG